MTARIRTTFAGIAFSGFDRGSGHVTVPTNVLRKILTSGKVCCRCLYGYTDDYAGDNDRNFDRGEVDPEQVLGHLLPGGKPWLCYLHNNVIRFNPHQARAYDIAER